MMRFDKKNYHNYGSGSGRGSGGILKPHYHFIGVTLLLIAVAVAVVPVVQASERKDMVSFYKNENQKGDKWEIKPFDYARNVLHKFPDDMDDAVESVKWRMPKGFAVILFDEHVETGTDNEKLRKMYKTRTFAMIGQGLDKTKEFDKLVKAQSKKNMEWFNWIKFNQDVGYVELFHKEDMDGARATLFLELFTEGKVHSMEGWDANNQLSSMEWSNLGDTVRVTFFTDKDGGGRPLTITGWEDDDTNHKKLKHFENINDNISSFKWERLHPIKAEIEDVTISVNTPATGKTYSTSMRGINQFPVEHKAQLSIEEANAITLETSLSSSFRFATSFSISATFSGFGVYREVGFKFTYDQKETTTHTRTEKHTTALKTQLAIDIPASSTYDIIYTATIGKVGKQTKTLKGKFWYDIPMPNSVEETINDGKTKVWRRDEEIVFVVEGDVSVATSYDANMTPLDDPPPKCNLRRRSVAANEVVDIAF